LHFTLLSKLRQKKADTLRWWQGNETRFRTLAVLARKYLAIGLYPQHRRHPNASFLWREASAAIVALLWRIGAGELECTCLFKMQLECGPMPNVMVALPNIGGVHCSTPQFG